MPAVGTDLHTVALAFQGTNINVYFDGVLKISTNDPAPYTNGGIVVDMTANTAFSLGVQNVLVTTLPVAGQ